MSFQKPENIFHNRVLSMKNSRKQIIAQIAQMDKVLQGQKKELTEHKEYFVQSKLTHYHLVIVVLIASAFL